MASISTDKQGRRRIQFFDGEGKRQGVSLGAVPIKTAKEVKRRIELIVIARAHNVSVDLETAEWLCDLQSTVYDKLVEAKLVPERLGRPSTELGDFADEYIKERSASKPATRDNWKQGRKAMVEYFGEQKPLADVTPGDGDNYRLHLLASGLAVMTARIRLQFARAVFRSATRHRLIGSNPFEDVTIKSSMPDKSYFVTPAEIATVIEAAPDHHWRLIIALARWGGLRTPSETLSLRWQDIDWERSRINVQSPKTERFANKGSRVIPLFPELLPYLRDSFDAAEDGAVYVVNPRYRKGLQRDRGWRDCNLRNMMLLILKRAGVKPWGRLFHNLRSSRQTELANKHPAHVVCSWLGNTEAVARQHYLQVTSEHFEAATKSAESVVHPVVQSVSVLPCRDSSGVANSAEIA